MSTLSPKNFIVKFLGVDKFTLLNAARAAPPWAEFNRVNHYLTDSNFPSSLNPRFVKRS
jgi:hypothetical protein